MVEEAFEEGVVHVVDDDEAIRTLVIRVLSTVGVQCVAWQGPADLLAAVGSQEIDALVIDIRLVGMSGLQLVRKLRDLGVTAPVIFISGVNEVPVAIEAMKLGALDFLPKPFATQALIDTTQQALRSHRPEQIRRRRTTEALDRIGKLSPRERQVFLAVVSGKANKVVAYDLGLSEKTVEEHRSRVMTKLKASSLVELVKYAVVAGVCDPAHGFEASL